MVNKKRYSVGILVVHGIGRQRRWRTARQFTDALEYALSGSGRGSVSRVADQNEQAEVLRFLGRTIRVEEGYWAERDRKIAVADLPKFVVWLFSCISMLPFLLLGSSGELKKNELDTSFRAHLKSQFRKDLRSIFGAPEISKEAIGTAWRILTLVGWIIVSLAIGRWLSSVLGFVPALMLAGGAGALLTMLILSKYNIVNQVRLAASADGGEAMLDGLESAVVRLHQRCEKTVVVAHSQGGYLAYELLKRPTVKGKVTAVFTVGSGLRGIVRIADLRARDGAIFLVGLIMSLTTLVLSAPVFNTILTTLSSLTQWLVVRLSAVIVVGASRPDEAARAMLETFGSELFQRAVISPASDAYAALTLPAVVAFGCNVALACGLYRYRSRTSAAEMDSERGFDIRSRTGVKEWLEFYTKSDLVGRVDSTELLTGIESVWLPGYGTPIGNHSLKHYLDRGMPLQYLLSAHIARIARVDGYSELLTRANENLAIQRAESESRYFFRAFALMNVGVVLAVWNFVRVEEVSISGLVLPLVLAMFIGVLGAWYQSQRLKSRGRILWGRSGGGLTTESRFVMPTDLTAGRYLVATVAAAYGVVLSALFSVWIGNFRDAPQLWKGAASTALILSALGFLYVAPRIGSGGLGRLSSFLLLYGGVGIVLVLVLGGGAVLTLRLGYPMILVAMILVWLSGRLSIIRPAKRIFSAIR